MEELIRVLENYTEEEITAESKFKTDLALSSFDIACIIDETEETLIDPEGRIIKQITVEDAKKANKLFEDLMGDGVTARKLYIKEHSKEAQYVI